MGQDASSEPSEQSLFPLQRVEAGRHLPSSTHLISSTKQDSEGLLNPTAKI